MDFEQKKKLNLLIARRQQTLDRKTQLAMRKVGYLDSWIAGYLDSRSGSTR